MRAHPSSLRVVNDEDELLEIHRPMALWYAPERPEPSPEEPKTYRLGPVLALRVGPHGWQVLVVGARLAPNTASAPRIEVGAITWITLGRWGDHVAVGTYYLSEDA